MSVFRDVDIGFDFLFFFTLLERFDSKHQYFWNVKRIRFWYCIRIIIWIRQFSLDLMFSFFQLIQQDCIKNGKPFFDEKFWFGSRNTMYPKGTPPDCTVTGVCKDGWCVYLN